MNWYEQEAERLATYTKDKDGPIVFQCGYGPSGLPHIGTFAEVARTTMVRRAFERITGKETKLIVFSDDMDALRSAPTNVPNRDMLERHLGKSLSSIPDPFGTHKSFAAHNNAKLQEFLDAYGFDYEFRSATECYQSGVFNDAIDLIARHAKEITSIVTHDYSPERKATYCPFIPVVEGRQFFDLSSWNIEQHEMNLFRFLVWHRDEWRGTLTSSIYEGNVKCQWKVDWPMRWIAFGVDYEMYGKDLLGSAKVGQKVCNLLDKSAPLTYMYELFTDEEGKKISKSVGNGLEFEEWVRYAPTHSLVWFLSQNPRKSRKLFWGMVPSTVDSFLKDDYDSEVLFGEDTSTPAINYQLLLNLVSITDTDDPNVLWTYINNYDPNESPGQNPVLDDMIRGAINYYHDKIAPFKEYRDPTEREVNVMRDLLETLERINREGRTSSEDSDYIMTYVYEVGKNHYEKDELRSYFKSLYEILMGQSSGPRFSQFVIAYGCENVCNLIRERIR